MKDAAVEEILQEAAEAFAIERAKQEMEHTYPSVKEVAAAVSIVNLLIALYRHFLHLTFFYLLFAD